MNKIDFIIFLILVSLVIWLFPKGLEKQIRVECLKLKAWKEDFPALEIPESQVEVCEDLGIDLR